MSEGPRPGGARPPAAVSPQERERSVRRLTRHFARDHLELPELERRLDLAFAARTVADLRALEEDLPELDPAADEAAAPAGLDPSLQAPARGYALAVMGGVGRKVGPVAPRHMTAVACMGGVELDFRETAFAESVTRVWVFALMGGIDVVVPPGVRVEARGLPLMGGFEDGTADEEGRPGPAAPVLKVVGVACMGGVSVSRRLPGETAGEARRRRKEAARAKRLSREAAAAEPGREDRDGSVS